MEWQVDITSWFILTIHESNWCHGWYIRGSSGILDIGLLLHWIICLLLKLLVSLMNWFVFFYRSASSISIDKIPGRYFLNFYFSMKWYERNLFFVSAFFFHVNPADIICTSELYHPGFWKINSSELNPLFVLCYL